MNSELDDNTEHQPDEDGTDLQDTGQPAATETQPADSGDGVQIGAKVPVFDDQVASNGNSQNSIHRFRDVKVSVSAELGSIHLPIGELLKITEGSVLELNRPIAEPIDLVAQGVRIARGEVVVIDDCFAVRVKEVEGQS